MTRSRPRVVAAAAGTVVLAVVVLPDLVRLDQATPFAQLVAFRPWLVAATAVLAVLLCALTAVRRGALPFAAGAVAVLVAGGVAVVPRTVAGPEPGGSDRITVLAFNTLDGMADVGALAELIRRVQPDVVSLPESGAAFQARIAPLVEPMGYRVHVSDPPGMRDIASVSALVSDRLGDVAVRTGRDTAAFPYLEITGGALGSLRVVAFHAAAPVPRNVAGWAADMALLARWCAGTGPAVVAGDLNATLDHSALRAGMRGCGDAAAQRGAGLVPTWGPGARSRHLGPQIDHVLATAGITAATFDVHDVPGSDHRAVVTTLVR